MLKRSWWVATLIVACADDEWIYRPRLDAVALDTGIDASLEDRPSTDEAMADLSRPDAAPSDRVTEDLAPDAGDVVINDVGLIDAPDAGDVAVSDVTLIDAPDVVPGVDAQPPKDREPVVDVGVTERPCVNPCGAGSRCVVGVCALDSVE